MLKKKYNRLLGGLYLLLLVGMPMLSLANDDTNALFVKANGLYAKAQYQQSVQLYKQILDEGYQSATLYFNTGNAYYKLGDIPSALLYYEKARKLAPGDEDININIQLANLKITDKIEPQPVFFVTSWWHSFILALPANSLAIFTVLLFIAGFATLVFYIFTNSPAAKRASFFGGVILLCFGVTTWFVANTQARYFSGHQQAIVFTPSVTAKSSPGAAANALFVVHEGTKVNVLQNNNGWVEIELPNGSAGWIAAEDIKEI